MSKGNGKDASPLVLSPSGQYTKLRPGMDTSDAESIDQQLRFATTQLKEHFRIEDDSPDTTTPEVLLHLPLSYQVIGRLHLQKMSI